MTGSTAARLRVRLTGGVAVEVDGVPVDGLGRPARLALAYLVCERHRPVPRDELADLLWGEDLPRSWEQLIRGITSRLRATLGKAGLDPARALTTAFGVQQLHLPPDAVVDVEEAADQVASARSALAAGANELAASAASAAAATTARQFLPEIAGTWVERRQAELRVLRVEALEALAEAEEALGQFSEAVVAAEQAVSLEPFRESAYLRLMTAHARAGNRGEALRVHERCRQVLSDELGVDPSPAMSAAHLALLRAPSRSVGGQHRSADEQNWSLALPATLSPAPGGFLVGRDAETELLTAAWQRALTDGRQAVLVSGEPGVGKTALVAQLARAAHAAGARVLYGRCDEDLGVPYQPFAEALGDYVAHCPVALLTDYVAAHGADLSRMVPELSRRLPGVPPSTLIEPEVDRYRLFRAVNGLLEAAGSSAPTVVILDDLHWATRATLLLLRHVLSAPAHQRLLVVATYRHTEVGADHPLGATLADLRRQRAVERVRLEGLDEEGVLAFVRAARGTPRDEDVDVSRALHASTAGNPFFLEELLRYLGETGGVYGRRHVAGSYYADGADLGVPEGVREVVGRRLRRLSVPEGRALEAASVIGGDFDVSLLARIVDPADASVVAEALEEVAGAHLVVEQERPGRYRFAHSLVRATIYEGLPSTRRMRLHLRVAETLDALPGDRGPRLAALAYHFAEAAPLAGADRAADHALAAARADFASAAWEDAAARLERGLAVLADEEAPDLERRCDLLLLLAEAMTRFFDPPRIRAASTAAVEAARALGSPRRLAQSAYWFVRSRDGSPEQFRAVEELVDEVRVAVGDSEPAAIAKMLAPVGAYRQYVSGGTDSTTGREALELARASGDQDALGVALYFRCSSVRGSPSLDEHLALADELVSAAPADGWDGWSRGNDRQAATRLAPDDKLICATPVGGWDGWRNGHDERARARLALGDRTGFECDIAACERIGAERGFWYFRWLGALRRTALALLDGRFDEVEALAARAREVSTVAEDPFASICHWRQTVVVRSERGDAAGAAAAARHLLELDEHNHINKAMAAFTQCQLVGPEAARAEVESLVDGELGRMPVERRPTTLAYRTELALTLGGHERARLVRDELIAWEGQIVVGGMAETPLGAVDRYLGMLAIITGNWDDAQARFEAALRLEDGLAAPPLLARTRYWYGRMLVARGERADLERADELLTSSRDAARLLGMARLHQEAVTLLGEVVC